MSLTSYQVDFYHHHGYLVLLDFFSLDEKIRLISTVSEIESWPETPGQWMRYYEPHHKTQEPLLCRIENFLPYSPKISSLVCGSKILSCLEMLVGEPVLLYKDKINLKYPGGNGFKPHQDSPAYTGQGQKNHITLLIAVDPMTVENGCLEFATNCPDIWQQRITLPHLENGSLDRQVIEKINWSPLQLQPGDAVIFGSYIPHRSGDNMTDHSRRSLYITFNPISEGDKHDQYYRDKRHHFPPPIEQVPGQDYSEGAKIYNLANPIFQ